jgi:sodium-independent sulfate anion transporter 11
MICTFANRSFPIQVGDLITPPAEIYHYWKISPIDVLIFFIGVMITVFNDITNGVFATIFLSVAVLLVRIFRAQGNFLGSAKVYTQIANEGDQSLQSTTESSDSYREGLLAPSRNVFLPLDRSDGSNPLVQIQKPDSGIFVYRLRDGLNYQNANHQLDTMVEMVYKNVRRTTTASFAKPGVSILLFLGRVRKS